MVASQQEITWASVQSVATAVAESDAGQPGLLTRSQIVDRILELNPTASLDFLSGFNDRALRNYLDHLIALQEPRGRLARWVRLADSPAITVSEPID